MNLPSNPFLRIPTAFLETSLLAMQSAMGAAQKAVATVAGATSEPLTAPPVDGPADVDTAVSDFMNRVARIARYFPLDPKELPAASTAVVAAARQSFGNLDFGAARGLTLPAELALSFGTLMTQSALRGLATLEVIGLEKMPTLLQDFFVMYSEQQVFVGLQYKRVISNYRERLAAAPDDHRTRIDLGRTLVKCGLCEEAAGELLSVPKDSPCYGEAQYEASIGLYRGGQFENAAKAGVAALQANPDNLRARSWLSLTAVQLGGYPGFVPDSCRMTVKAGFEKTALEYEDIAAQIGIDKTSAGRGVAIFDFDNDGYLDIAVTAAQGGCNLYRNNHDGTFTDVSVGSGLDTSVNGHAILAGDYNNDGYPDLFITRLGFYCGEGQLFRNNGDGTFTDVTQEAGLKVWGPAFAASWVDYDNDGFLDLFIANNLGGLFERKTPNRLFHNNGDGTFTEVTEQAGLHTIWPSICGAWGDYDNDGFPDLFISNGVGRSQLYHNNGDGTFTDVSEKAGVTESCFGSLAYWIDYDNDGWMDIVQYTWSNHEDVIHTMMHGEGPPDGSPARVYHNNRDGTFTERGRELGLTGCWGTMSGNAADLNNDGHLDLVLGNGSPKVDRLDPMILMEFNGSKYRNITFAAGLPQSGKSHGVTVGDLFGDGRITILVGAGGAYPSDLLTVGAYRPKTLPGNYVNVRLVGVESNRAAMGARISVEAEGRKQHREISGGSNFGCLPLEQHFGLADLTMVDAVELKWPSGLKQRFTGLRANKTYEFTEGHDGWRDVYAKRHRS